MTMANSVAKARFTQGILQPKVEHVAGTVNVYERQRRTEEQLQQDRVLERDATGKIILVPQPSNDPNDPLVRNTFSSV